MGRDREQRLNLFEVTRTWLRRNWAGNPFITPAYLSFLLSADWDPGKLEDLSELMIPPQKAVPGGFSQMTVRNALSQWINARTALLTTLQSSTESLVVSRPGQGLPHGGPNKRK